MNIHNSIDNPPLTSPKNELRQLYFGNQYIIENFHTILTIIECEIKNIIQLLIH
uniref:Bm1406 n=1 Tax=Brugia malayi TaxID=6279 RepID=A0A0J9XYF0_BRUMA|nr:Bm1406 [Brugia malayi]